MSQALELHLFLGCFPALPAGTMPLPPLCFSQPLGSGGCRVSENGRHPVAVTVNSAHPCHLSSHRLKALLGELVVPCVLLQSRLYPVTSKPLLNGNELRCESSCLFPRELRRNISCCL